MQSSGIGYIDHYHDMTKIDEKYIDIKPKTNMHISEGWRAYRHDRLIIKVYNTFGHKFGCDTRVKHKGSLTLAMGKCLWFSVKIKVCK